MPGLMSKPSSGADAPSDMTMDESYERLAMFVTDREPAAHHFSIDDDNHGVGLLTAHIDNRREATTVRLDKSLIRGFMLSQGYDINANTPDNANHNPTLSPSGFIATKRQA